MPLGTSYAGRPAAFDSTSQHRRAMLGKVHIAKKQLAMDEDDYRQALLDHTGKLSAADCSEAELARLLAFFGSKGFKPLPPSTGSGRAAGKPAANHPMARKARAMWISLHHLGVVHNPSEPALEAFAKRQLGCERLQWARQPEANKLIEALKAMAERAGWRQTGANGRRLSPLMLQMSLTDRILHRLREVGEVPEHWTLAEAAFRLCGIELVTVFDDPVFAVQHYSRLAAALGAKLRAAAPAGALAEGDGQ